MYVCICMHEYFLDLQGGNGLDLRNRISIGFVLEGGRVGSKRRSLSIRHI